MAPRPAGRLACLVSESLEEGLRGVAAAAGGWAVPAMMEFLTIREAALRLRVSYNTIRGAILAGRLKAYRFGARGGAFRIAVADLEAYRAACATTNQEPPAPRKSAGGGSAFKNLDGERLLDAWRRQGAVADRRGGRSAPS